MPPMDPAAAMGGMPPLPPGGGLDPAAAMGGEPPPPPEGIPPPGQEGGGSPRVDPETGETMLPMSEVENLLGAVTGKRAPPKEQPAPPEDPNAAAAVEGAAAAAPNGDQQTLSNPVAPLGGLDPSALSGIG